MIKQLKTGVLISSLLLGAAFVQPVMAADEALDINALLNLVKKGQARDNREFKERMSRFTADKNEQAARLKAIKAERAKLEKTSEQQEALYAKNETKLAEQQARLVERLGSLKELFGVLQQVAGDTKGVFQGSIISAQVPARDEFLTQLIKDAGSGTSLPSMQQLEQLWFEMQREMTYSGQVVRFDAEVVVPTGETTTQQVIRVGSFNAIADNKYLNYDIEAQKLVQLANQPSKYLDGVKALTAANDGFTGFWIDPARGQLLTIMGQSASLKDRIEQGGTVGYIILALAVFGIGLAIVLMLILFIASRKIHAQMKNNTASNGNALGRIMQVYQKYEQSDLETLELHLSEAIAVEAPKLTRGVNWIKIISVVAPLLGLLGTVTGMIDVFETMSLFGTGDPKLMAGGISQALVTTVLGLVAAIPCVFLHTLVNNRSRQLIMLLEERATGILAKKSEQAEAA